MRDAKETVSCRWCGEDHGSREYCPVVKAIDFDAASGKVTRVEFLTPVDCGPPLNVASADNKSSDPDYPTLRPTRRG
jgi:hypothetical protein